MLPKKIRLPISFSVSGLFVIENKLLVLARNGDYDFDHTVLPRVSTTSSTMHCENDYLGIFWNFGSPRLSDLPATHRKCYICSEVFPSETFLTTACCLRCTVFLPLIGNFCIFRKLLMSIRKPMHQRQRSVLRHVADEKKFSGL